MILYLLNSGFKPVQIIDDASSFVLTRRYFAPSEITLTLPREKKLSNKAVYIYDPHADFYGVIEDTVYEDGKSKRICARGLESLLERRINTEVLDLEGDLEDVVRNVVNKNVISGRNIAGLVMGERRGLGVWTKAEASNLSISEWAYEALKPYGASFTVKYNASRSAPEFRVVKGRDRTRGQSTLGPVVFSEISGSAGSTEFKFSEKDLRTVAYVKGSDGTTVVVPDTPPENLARREIFISARDITPSYYSDEDEYTDALFTRGTEELAKRSGKITLNGKVTSREYAFPEDYELGDTCELELMGGGVYSVTVTKVVHEYHGGEVNVTTYFGEEESSLSERIRTETKNYAGNT